MINDSNNKRAAQVFLATIDAISRKDADWPAQQALVTPDFSLHPPDGQSPPTNFEGLKEFSIMFTAGFPGYQHVIEDQIGEGDKVVNRITWHGTHDGTFNGVEATHRTVSMNIINIMRFENGKVAEYWILADVIGLMKQIS